MKNIPLNSLEGFIRQMLGWREFIRIVYERERSKQRTKNFWGFERKIPESFWLGLFWRFMHVNRDFFLKNPRLGMLVKTFDKMPEEKRKKHIDVAENYLNQLD